MRPKTGSLAAIYCRVSTKQQATDEKSCLQTQERECHNRAAELGLIVAEGYIV